MENTTQLSGDCWRATVKPHGTIAELGVLQEGSWRRIAFRDDTHAGPRWHGEWDGGEHQVGLQPNPGSARFASLYDGLRWSLAYQAHPSHLAIIASVRNERAETFRPARAGLRLGLDTYMERFPEWNRILFPTCLRCEQTHFWGTCMSPEGTILGLASPDPVASWSLVYNRASYGDWGHRIYTLNLDLLNAPPLPARFHFGREEKAAADALFDEAIATASGVDLRQMRALLAELEAAGDDAGDFPFFTEVEE